MTYKFTIQGQLPNLNDYLQAERIQIHARGKFTTRGNNMKHRAQDMIIAQITRDLKGLKITKPVKMHYVFFEPNRKRDLDNVLSFATKVTQDSLVLAGTLENDGWTNIVGISSEFHVDAGNPRIEVYLIEQNV